VIPTTARLPEPLRTLVRAAGWHRRLLAAACAAAAVAFGLSAVAPAPPPVVRILTAAHDLPAGSTLGAGDVRLVGFAPSVVPAGALRVSASAVGLVLAGAMRRGEPLTDIRVVGPALLGSLATSGLVAAPVRIADPGAARLLQPGAVVDVLASSERETRGPAPVVASGVRVVTVPVPDGDVGGLDDGALVVLATTPATAAVLARAAVSSRLSVTIRGG
jgi:pilus assembly protein CpaB